MSSATSPYRVPAAACPFCGADLATGGGETSGSVRLCTSCAAGNLDRALRRWGFGYHHAERSKGASTRFHFVEITRATDLDVLAKLRPEGLGKKVAKLFGARELRSGHGALDEAVFIEADPEQEALLGSLLEREGVRRAILALLRLGGRDKRDNCVDLTGRLVGAVVAWSRDEAVPAKAEIDRHLMALAIEVEAFAKG